MRFLNLHRSIGTAALLLTGLFISVCKGKPAPPPVGPTEVAFVTVQPEKVVLTTELPGRTNAYLVAEIRPQVSGAKINSIFGRMMWLKRQAFEREDLRLTIDSADLIQS